MQVEPVSIGRLLFDPASGEATVGGQRLELPRREIRVLAALARRLGRTVLRESVEMAVYGFDDGIHSNTLDSHGSRLRRKLADADAGVALKVAERCQRLLQKKNILHALSPHGRQVTVSIGAGTVMPEGEAERAGFIKAVDQQLYTAKNNGRHRIEHVRCEA
ncbi:hypothetical protein G6F40_015721 [Rhizopus arrhizus]|nr:hypothetical protein G6F40_015721 [Rhizopus arrhizus]